MPLAATDAIPDKPSAQLEVVLTWMRALSSADPSAAEILGTTLTEDHTYHFLPRSLGYPARNKAQFLAYARKVPLSLFKNPQVRCCSKMNVFDDCNVNEIFSSIFTK